jgi:UDP-N-acetylmuramate-alanine ligase
LSSNVGRVNIDPRWFKPVHIAATLDNPLQSSLHIHGGHQFAQRIVAIIQPVKYLREKHLHDSFAAAG